MTQALSYHLREATPEDAPGIMVIYNDAVLNSTAIWNDTIVDQANRASWLTDRQKLGFPVLVAVDNTEQVLGYASFGDWRAFDGYKYTVEHSVYVHPQARGQGLARALMLTLIERAQQMRKHVMVAGIEANNMPSIALHEGLGFVQTGRLPEVGTKFGKWLDLVFMQRILTTS